MTQKDETYVGLPISEVDEKDVYFKGVKRKPLTTIFHSKEYKTISTIRRKLKLSEKEWRFVQYLIKKGFIRNIEEETYVGNGVHKLYREGDIRNFIDKQRIEKKKKLKGKIESFRENNPFIKGVVRKFFKEKPIRRKYFSDYEVSLYLAEFLFGKQFPQTESYSSRMLKKLEKRFVMI